MRNSITSKQPCLTKLRSTINKWADLDELVNSESHLWIDFLLEDHCRLANALKIYLLPDLRKITFNNVDKNWRLFEAVLENSMPYTVKHLHITCHYSEYTRFDKTLKLLEPVCKNVKEELRIGNFNIQTAEFYTTLQSFSH